MNIPERIMCVDKCAVVIIDVQNDYCNEKGELGKIGFRFSRIQKLLQKLPSFVHKMRVAGLPIFHFQMTEDPLFLEKNLLEKQQHSFGVQWKMSTPGTWGYELILTPAPTDVVLKKNSYDIFSNSDFSNMLQERGVETLIFVGGFTHVCVDTSIRSAVSKGYHAVIVSDLVGVPDHLEQFHENAIKVIGLMFGYCLTSEEVIVLFRRDKNR
ncbi:cysteine hydrolase [Candidatus Woesearchaeota archaeon]|nr:cysteine hydrolase [Candidatus Woesearchaeota archaeon]